MVLFNDPNKVYVLDGGFGSLLEHLGYSVDKHELWSGGANIDRPDLVLQAHQQFIEAGADIIMTNSYHCSINKMQEVGSYSLEQAEQSISEIVNIAKSAIKSSKHPSTLLVGAVGPYATYLKDGSEYTGAYTKKPDFDPQTIVKFYLMQTKPLLAAGIQCLVFETIPSLIEVKCVGKVLDQLDNSIQAWVVVSCEDESRTRSGDSFQEIVRLVNTFPKACYIGINCTSPLHITSLLQIAALVNGHKPFVVYPNSGEVYNTNIRKFEGNKRIDMIAQLIPSWHKLGDIKMDDLREMNSRRLFKVLALSYEEFIKWLQSLGLLFKSRTCSGKLDENGEHKEGSCGGKSNMSYHYVGRDSHLIVIYRYLRNEIIPKPKREYRKNWYKY